MASPDHFKKACDTVLTFLEAQSDLLQRKLGWVRKLVAAPPSVALAWHQITSHNPDGG